MIKQTIKSWVLLPLALTLVGLGGCSSFGPLTITPVESHGNAALLPHFASRWYYTDRDGAYHFVLESGQVGHGKVKQILTMRVFWRPIPGITPIRASAINATFTYMVITPAGTGRYTGAGFVRIHNGPQAPVMHASLVDGNLRLASSSGYFHDPLGPARVSGDFTAEHSTRRTIALALAAQRLYFVHAQRTALAGQ